MTEILSFLRSTFPAGRLSGVEYVLGSLQGEAGRSLSVNTQTGVWMDFSTGQKGCGIKSICRAMKIAPPVDYAPPQRTREEWEPLKLAKNKPYLIQHERFGIPAAVWLYRAINWHPIGYVCRWNTPSGKQILPYCQCLNRSTGEVKWRWKSFAKPRPLYGLPKLRSDKPVLLCEGEKAADAAQILRPEYSAMTWPGGSSAVAYADWFPLRCREVLIWPDNDEPGMKAAQEIKRRLPKARIIDIDPALPKGWDAADELAARENVRIQTPHGDSEAHPVSVPDGERDSYPKSSA